MKTGLLAIAALAIASLPVSAGQIIYGTGVDDDNNSLAAGATDTHYAMSGLVTQQAIVDSHHYFNWVSGQWVSNADLEQDACCGNAVFTTTLDLIGYTSGSGTLASLFISLDDSSSDILINGVDQPGTGLGSSPWTSLHQFDITASTPGLQWNALNTVAFTVNFADVETNGLLVQVSNAQPLLDSGTPEPASLMLAGSGLIALCALARRLRRS